MGMLLWRLPGWFVEKKPTLRCEPAEIKMLALVIVSQMWRLKINYLFLLCMLLGFGRAAAQAYNLDSALRVLSTAPDDTAKVLLLCDVAWEVSYQDLQKGLVYAEQSLTLVKKLGAERQYARVFYVAGSIYNDMSEHGLALDLFLQALKYTKKYQLTRQEGYIYNSLGNFYNREGDMRKAISFYLLSARTHSLAGAVEPIYRAYNNLGGSYLKINQPDSAVYYVSLCKQHNLKSGNSQDLVYNNIALSEIYTEIGDRAVGLAFADSAVAGARINGDNYTLVRALVQQCYALDVTARTERLIPALDECIKLSVAIGDLTTQLQAYNLASNAYSRMGNYKQALEYYRQYKAIDDSIHSGENIRQIRMAEARYENGKKQAEIQLLAEKQKLSEAQQEKNRLYLYLAGVGLVALAVLLALVYRNNRNEQRNSARLARFNSEISQQKELVERKNKEIVDSISYAQRIQQSLLTSHHYFKRHCRDYFILFKPKDIVSGDFYWAQQRNGKLLLLTADCTGHGVPGALMSMMGINLMNSLVNERQLEHPAQILNQLRRDIVHALNPEDSLEEGKDGMDCSLCSFDLANGRLRYANANNSFYFIREGQLQQAMVNKMPVGAGQGTETPFDEFEMLLQPGDLVVTLTDGYADQFGGPKGKKFKYRQLEELLVASAHLPMQEIRQRLDEAIQRWQGELEQVDDICLIGIRI